VEGAFAKSTTSCRYKLMGLEEEVRFCRRLRAWPVVSMEGDNSQGEMIYRLTNIMAYILERIKDEGLIRLVTLVV